MRRIGTLGSESSARRFVDFLYTQSIDALVTEPTASERTASGNGDAPTDPWEVWVRDESDVEKAKSELLAFQDDPNEARFGAESDAVRMRMERIERERVRIAAHRDRDRQLIEAAVTESSASRSSLSESISSRDEALPLGSLPEDRVRQMSIPLTIAIIVISVLIGFTTNFDQPRGSAVSGQVTLENRVYSNLSFVDRDEFERSGGDPFASIRKGQVWRLVTPMFLHGNMFHLAFNMLWIFFLGSAIERLHGSWVFAALLLLTQIAGMMLQVLIPALDWIPQSLQGSPFAIGASGAVYGLFGFLMIRPLVDRDYPIQLDPVNVALMMGWLFACMTPLIPNVANGAHLGGLIAGIMIGAIGYFTKRS